MGLALESAGRLPDAEHNLLEAITVWEQIRKQPVLWDEDVTKVIQFEQQVTSYRSLQRVLVAQNKTDTALEIAERD